MMKTGYQILRTDDSTEIGEVDWPEQPSYQQIKKLVGPLLNNEPLEHVSVLHKGKHADMFVSEVGHLTFNGRRPLPRNNAATVIYRSNWLTKHPQTPPDSMHWIAGTAVLFDRIVWT